MGEKKRPGWGGNPKPRPNSPDVNGKRYNPERNEKLAVDLVPTAAEREFASVVMRRLPGVIEPRIFVLINDKPRHPVTFDAQVLANQHGEAVAIADQDGNLLAYRMPDAP
jgi:hypothetical protein